MPSLSRGCLCCSWITCVGVAISAHLTDKSVQFGGGGDKSPSGLCVIIACVFLLAGGDAHLCSIPQQTTAEMHDPVCPEPLTVQQEDTECLFPPLAAFISSFSLIRCLSRVPSPSSICRRARVRVSYTSRNASTGSVVYVHLSTSLMDDGESVARLQLEPACS